jgi:hypothetical protein
LNPQTPLSTPLIIDKEGNIVSNKEKVLNWGSEYNEKHFELQDGTDNGSGEYWTECVQTAEPRVEPPIRGGVRSTRGLGPTTTARGQSTGISIGMLPQTLIMSRLDQLSQLGSRI